MADIKGLGLIDTGFMNPTWRDSGTGKSALDFFLEGTTTNKEGLVVRDTGSTNPDDPHSPSDISAAGLKLANGNLGVIRNGEVSDTGQKWTGDEGPKGFLNKLGANLPYIAAAIGGGAIASGAFAGAEAAAGTGTAAAAAPAVSAAVGAGAGGAATGILGTGVTLGTLASAGSLATSAMIIYSALSGKNKMTAPPPPAAPALPVTMNDPQVASGTIENRRRAMIAGGVMSNVATGSQGLLTAPATTGQGKSLLGA